MIRYLKQEEKRRTLPLWKEAFPEETDGFLEYYYTEKTRDNKILAAEDEKSGEILSMLHRNPYRVQAGDQVWNADYIVAVATAKGERRRGLMRNLLTRTMEDMYRENMGFCFLMPADVKIYEPFDFAVIYEQPWLRLKDRAEQNLKKVRVGESEQDIGRAAQWMDQWLEERYQVFARRTPEYVKRLIRELESEDGWMELLVDRKMKAAPNGWQESVVKGIRCWWGLHEREQRMLLTHEAYTEPAKGEKTVIMARIIHLETFLKAVKLSPGGKRHKASMKVRLKVEDSVCRENNGVFLWTVGEDASRLCLWEDGMEAEEDLEISMAHLTRWLFGRGEELCENAPWMKEIHVLSRVFLDEIV